MTEQPRWDEYLIAEHELIERAMAVLKTNLEKLDDQEHDPRRMRRALDFLLEFGDAIHNRKEENHLFPLMHSRGIPKEGGPLGVMIAEHDAERTLLRQMLAGIDTLSKADLEEVISFKQDGLEYLAIRAEHIWKENDILYPMARQVLKPGDAENLLSSFTKINEETYGPEASDKFGRMVEEMEQQSPGEKAGLIHNLSYRQIEAIMETLPVEVTFVDAQDTVAYFNRLDKKKIFPRTRSVIGRKVDKCHPEKSVHMVLEIVAGFKNRTMDQAEFWINFRDETVLIRYFPVYSDDGEYLGVMEVTQEIGRLQKLTGEKRLLHS
ncbi:MAG: PAS domain-containing protein [Proteobacteria bacterium]|nr:PAS domain-containing protein [Pseudomonadota bacterium]MBU1686396.1 PAS domain-containing protein [Pseudomonadota bacterium]